MEAAVVVAAWLAAAGLVDAVRAGRHRALVLRRLRPAADVDRARMLAVLVVAVVAAAVGPSMALLLAAGAAGALPVRAVVRRRHAADRADDDLPDVVDDLARALRSGAPTAAALRTAGFDDVARATGRGVPLAVAFEQWASAATADGAHLVATAVAVTSAAGGDVGRPLTSVADTLRERRALRREVRALSAQARTSAVVVAVAPVAFAVVAGGTDGATAGFLLRTPAGWACLVTGLALDGAGWWWMDRITRTIR